MLVITQGYTSNQTVAGGARINAIADAVAANVLALWLASSSPPGADDGVERVYETEIRLQDANTPFVGRHVYVFPTHYQAPAADEVGGRQATRAQSYRDYRVAVLVVEQYRDGPAPVPTAWIDARLAFVEQVVWAPLQDPRRGPILAGVFPWGASEVITYDVDELVQRKLFLSVITASLRQFV